MRYVSTSLKLVILLSAPTVCTACVLEDSQAAVSPAPITTLADILALRDTRVIDMHGIVKEVSEVRQVTSKLSVGSTREVADVLIVDDSQTGGAFASVKVSVWRDSKLRDSEHDLISKVQGMVNIPILLFAVRAACVDGKLSVDTVKDSHIYKDSDSSRGQALLLKVAELTTARATMLTTEWVPKDKVDVSGPAVLSCVAMLDALASSQSSSATDLVVSILVQFKHVASLSLLCRLSSVALYFSQELIGLQIQLKHLFVFCELPPVQLTAHHFSGSASKCCG